MPRQAWCELRDANRSAIADIAWNPTEGLQIATALGDDQSPVIKLWDLRSSTTLPLATLKGHAQGLLSMSWCPNDTSLLLSCGKDNRTFLWNLFECKPVYELQVGNLDQGDLQRRTRAFQQFRIGRPCSSGITMHHRLRRMLTPFFFFFFASLLPLSECAMPCPVTAFRLSVVSMTCRCLSFRPRLLRHLPRGSAGSALRLAGGTK